jgi:hypothetical protein
VRESVRVLICGDREWTDSSLIHDVLEHLKWRYGEALHVISGGARGADYLADQQCKSLGITFTRVPAQWERYGRAAGPIRNGVMMNMHPDIVIAFHSDLTKSKGTKNMVMVAEMRIKRVYVIATDDDVEKFKITDEKIVYAR